jgi:hypothetical protein
MLNDDFLVSHRDLQKHGYVNPNTGRAYSYKHIIDMEKRDQWPRGVWVSPNRKAWWNSELRRRYENLPRSRTMREPADAA